MGRNRRVGAAELDTNASRPRGLNLRRLVDDVGGWFSPNPTSEAVTTKVRLDASPEAVWKVLAFYEDIPRRPGSFLLALLPRPVRSEGDKRRVGANVRCEYEGGHLVKRITVAAPNRLLRFEVLEQNLGLEKSISTTEGSYEIRPSEGGSDVLLTTQYRSNLRPRLFWRPFERFAAHHVHRHILRGMRTLLGATSRDRATAEMRSMARVARATSEPGSESV